MKKLTSLIVAHALLLSLLAPLAGAQQTPTTPPSTTPQQSTPPSQQPAPDDDDDSDVVRITTNLVQVDAVVVDKKGNQVTDLSADDFEILEDNRPQKLTNFSYVLNESVPRPAETADRSRKSGDKTGVLPPAPPRRLRPEQVRRTMALVVDDLGLSFESTAFVRTALRKFVDEQMQPNDLVAIIRTSAGMGALQQFTSDKRQLHAAIDRVKWFMSGRGGVSVFAPIEGSVNAPGPVAGEERDGNLRARRGEEVNAELEDFREEIFAVGTLGALNFVVRGMRELPGRKSVLLMSDGFALFTADRGHGRSDRVLQALRQLTDLANRASVVVYTIDARGLVVTGLTAADDTSGMSPQQIESAISERSNQIFDTQSGLSYLSQQTGGFLIKNNNDLSGGIRRVVEDQKGYYLLGYRPDGATFDRRYHRISVKVKRPGLKVRTRTGFFGVRDEETRPVRRTREQQLFAAITSPFASPDVRLRLTTFFGNTAEEGSFMRSMLYLDGNDVKFSKEPDGKYKAVLDVVGVTFGDNGRVIESLDRIHTLTMPEDAYRRVLRQGITYTMNVPIKKPGAYQLRMAVRDTATERTGSASQFIEVPDLKKNRLAMSGLIVTGGIQETAKVGATMAATNTSPASADETDMLGSPAVRRFHQNANLELGYAVYNARLDKATGLPQVTAQTRIFRDGQIVFSGKEQPVIVQLPTTDVKRIGVIAQLRLGPLLKPGEYVMQVIVTDTLRKDKHRVTTQWIDFEVYK